MLLQTLDNEDPNHRVKLNETNDYHSSAFFISCLDDQRNIVKMLLETLKNKDPSKRIEINQTGMYGILTHNTSNYFKPYCTFLKIFRKVANFKLFCSN